MGPFAFSLGMLMRRPKAVKADSVAAKSVKIRTDWIWSETNTLDDKTPLLHMHRPGEPDRRHVITSIHASYTVPLIGFMTLQYNMDVRGRWYVHGQRDVSGFFAAAEGEAIRVSLNSAYHPTTDKVTPALTVVGYTEHL